MGLGERVREGESRGCGIERRLFDGRRGVDGLVDERWSKIVVVKGVMSSWVEFEEWLGVEEGIGVEVDGGGWIVVGERDVRGVVG